jgi:hypothetical protein
MRALLPMFIVLGACGLADSPGQSTTSETNGASERPATSLVGSDVLVTYVLAEARPGVPPPTFHTARLAGDVAVKDACVGLVSGGKFVILAFSSDEAVWDQQRRELVVRGSAYGLGNPVEVGGSTSGGAWVKEVLPDVPGRCNNAAPTWYVAPGSLAALVP